jgi:polyhydroxybutyrate depolymerase
MPLLLVFHGGGGSGAGMPHFTGFDPLADRYGMLVVYPSGIDRQWNDGGEPNNGVDDVEFVAALIHRLAGQYPIDRTRIFAAGISNGAMFSQRLGCELTDRIAGFAAVDGNMPTAIASSCRPQRAVSMLQMSGTDDPLMPFAGGKVTIGRHVSVRSASSTVAFWARNDGCSPLPATTTLPSLAPSDGTSIVRERYTGCRSGSQVTYYIVRGGGHTWPGGYQYLPAVFIGRTSNQLDASQTIVEFFLNLKR